MNLVKSLKCMASTRSASKNTATPLYGSAVAKSLIFLCLVLWLMARFFAFTEV